MDATNNRFYREPASLTVSYTCEYDDCGGYDCMTAAYQIKLDGELKVVVDLGNFGQDQCQPADTETTAAAKKVADIITAALNAA